MDLTHRAPKLGIDGAMHHYCAVNVNKMRITLVNLLFLIAKYLWHISWFTSLYKTRNVQKQPLQKLGATHETSHSDHQAVQAR